MPSVHGHGGHSPFLMLYISVLNLLHHSCTVLEAEHLRSRTELSCSARCIEGNWAFPESSRAMQKSFRFTAQYNWCNWMSRTAGITVLGKGSRNEIFDGADVQKSLKVKKMHHFLWLAIPRNTQSMTILCLHRHNLSFWLSLLRTSLPRSKRRQVRQDPYQ